MKIEHLINNLLNERKIRNNAYSLRALARDLKLDVGQLHRIVRSQMAPTPLVAYRIGKHLNLKADDILEMIESTLH
jgi:plasmid maintenance system antidote protein VapI